MFLHHNAFLLVRIRLPPHHPLLRLLHYSLSPNAHPQPQHTSTAPGPAPPHAAELWIAKALASAALLRPHILQAFLGLAPSPLAAAAAVRLAPSAAAALHIFSSLHSPPLSLPPSEHSYRHVISLLCKSGRHSDALKLFDQMMDQSGCFPDAGFFSFVAGSCTHAGLLDAAATLLARGSQFGCHIEAYAYNKLMNSFIAHGRAQEAVALFESWIQEGLYSPDVWSFNVVIKGVCRVSNVRKALELVERMGEFGCSPDTVTHNILVDGLCRVNEVNKGREVLRRLQRDGVCMPNVVTYTSVISGYCKAGRMEDAMAVYNDMLESGTKPNTITYNVLINGYGKAGDIESAVGMYQQLMLRRCPPDVVTFSSLIDGYCRCGQLDGAMRIWKEMAQYHIQPNVYTFSIMIHSVCKQNRSEDALGLLRELNMREDIAPRAFIYNPVIDVLCKGGKVDEANSILLDMEEKRCHPDNCLLKAGMPNEVERIMLISSGHASSCQKVCSRQSPRLDISVAV
ncbi:hypothetical protein HU200_027390 [Digitaria exilis]|uniref:Pentatricopeptide repeat-containing protein n=1 Tax=Digitaria exilis TaxID=1010633 RepID=A0A835EWC6_9POAL|nr:hypothetical protein HU200_027390 [Digitaria exilis]